jgi:hypothetical protein
MRKLLLPALLLFAIFPAHGGIIAEYTFTGGSTTPLTSSISGLQGSDLTRNGVTPILLGNPNAFFGTDWPVGTYGSGYFQVTLTPDAGISIDYSLVSFDYTIGTNPTFTTELVSSVDGFTTPLSSHDSGAGITGYSDSLAALGLQGGPVTFRMYGYVDSNFGSSGFYAGSVDFSATADPLVASTPEPSALNWFAGAGALLLVLLRRFTLPDTEPRA